MPGEKWPNANGEFVAGDGDTDNRCTYVYGQMNGQHIRIILSNAAFADTVSGEVLKGTILANTIRGIEEDIAVSRIVDMRKAKQIDGSAVSYQPAQLAGAVMGCMALHRAITQACANSKSSVTNVLIHCQDGHERSPSALILYLATQLQLDFNTAHEIVTEALLNRGYDITSSNRNKNFIKWFWDGKNKKESDTFRSIKTKITAHTDKQANDYYMEISPTDGPTKFIVDRSKRSVGAYTRNINQQQQSTSSNAGSASLPPSAGASASQAAPPPCDVLSAAHPDGADNSTANTANQDAFKSRIADRTRSKTSDKKSGP